MIDISKNTYRVEADKDVEKVVEWIVNRLQGHDTALVESGEVGGLKISGSGCAAPEHIALEAARLMIEAGYHASVCRYEATGCFAWAEISKRPISGSYSERVMG